MFGEQTFAQLRTGLRTRCTCVSGVSVSPDGMYMSDVRWSVQTRCIYLPDASSSTVEVYIPS